MRTAELLQAMASWLESPNNEAMLLAENDEKALKVVAESCVLAAALLKSAAEEVDLIEPQPESLLTPEAIEQTAAIATAFDASGDPQLKKMASVLDELLLTIAAPPNALAQIKQAEDDRIEQLRKRYEQPRKDLHEYNKIGVSEQAIDKSNFAKPQTINERPLQTRTCPDHPGAQMSRVGEHMFQCDLDKKQYNYETGYTLENGEHVPGGSVDLQTGDQNTPFHAIFDTRQGRLGYNS
jgi:hypothetical protein